MTSKFAYVMVYMPAKEVEVSYASSYICKELAKVLPCSMPPRLLGFSGATCLLWKKTSMT